MAHTNRNRDRQPTSRSSGGSRSGSGEGRAHGGQMERRGLGRTMASDAGRSGTPRRASDREYPTWRDPSTGWMASPLQQFRSWADQMERWVSSLGSTSPGQRTSDWGMSHWMPQIETFQRGDQLIIRADLPGLKRGDVHVEVTDDAVIIEGERRDEFTDEREGYYRSERSYGSFYRAVPLPSGAITEDAKASFSDGVLEITMSAPPEPATRGRRIEIEERGEGEPHEGHITRQTAVSGARSGREPKMEEDLE